MLVDWGLARKFGGECAGRGVPAYAATATLKQVNCQARPTLDLEAAVYTWLAVVYGNNFCDAPWIQSVYNLIEELEVRDEWLFYQSKDPFIIRAAAAVAALQKVEVYHCESDLYVGGAAGFWGLLSTTDEL